MIEGGRAAGVGGLVLVTCLGGEGVREMPRSVPIAVYCFIQIAVA